MHRFFAFAITMIVFGIGSQARAQLATFDDLPLAPESYVNDSLGFSSGQVGFNNTYTDFGTFETWAGFAYSNITDNTTPGFGNQYSAWAGGGAGGSSNYAIGFVDDFAGVVPTISFNVEKAVIGIDVTNTTYTGLAMRDGDSFSKKFGGESGDDPDFFTLHVTGRDALGDVTGVVDFDLADYRFEDNELDYIVDAWTFVDLTALGAVKTLELSFSSSDVGSFGINTPLYAAVDNVQAVPTPGAAALGAAGLLMLAGAGRRRARRAS